MFGSVWAFLVKLNSHTRNDHTKVVQNCYKTHGVLVSVFKRHHRNGVFRRSSRLASCFDRHLSLSSKLHLFGAESLSMKWSSEVWDISKKSFFGDKSTYFQYKYVRLEAYVRLQSKLTEVHKVLNVESCCRTKNSLRRTTFDASHIYSVPRPAVPCSTHWHQPHNLTDPRNTEKFMAWKPIELKTNCNEHHKVEPHHLHNDTRKNNKYDRSTTKKERTTTTTTETTTTVHSTTSIFWFPLKAAELQGLLPDSAPAHSTGPRHYCPSTDRNIPLEHTKMSFLPLHHVSQWWYDICDTWYLTRDVWCKMFDICWCIMYKI